MRYRLLGPTGLRVSEVFLGAMRFGAEGRGTTPREARRILDAFADAGGTTIDTALMYGDGRSERIVGSFLGTRRDRFVVGSKFTPTRDGRDPNAAGSHRKNLTRSLEASLRNLGTDHLDVYWVHLWDPHTPVEETLRALDDAVSAGKVLYLGISDTPAWVVARADTLATWHAWTRFAAIQVPYNLLARDAERDLLPMAESLGLSVVAWGPTAGGELLRGSGPRGSDTPGSRSTDALRVVVREVADELGATPAQVAIAWTRARSPAVLPIIGARTIGQLHDNLGALELALPEDARARLEAATDFTLGFPGDFLARVHPISFGAVSRRVDGRGAELRATGGPVSDPA